MRSRATRIRAVCHSERICRRSPDVDLGAFGVVEAALARAHQVGDLRCASNTVRRRVSVGCAVMTGATSASVSSGRDLRGVEVRGVEHRVGRGEAAALRWLTRGDVDAPAALAMDVLGQVGQQREVAERTNDRDRDADVDPVEQLRHLGAVDLGVPDPERLDAGLLDEIEHVLARVFAHGLAEDAAEQSNVVAERFRRVTVRPGRAHASSIDAGPPACMQWEVS